MRNRLFLLDPNYRCETGGKKYCPACATVSGYLQYYPELREQLDISVISPEKPRSAIVEILGEENQSSPVLVLSPDSPLYDDLDIKNYRNTEFVNRERDILLYLGRTYGAGLPL